MASIDAFWDLAALEPASKPALRLSLRRLAPPASATPDQRTRRKNASILIGIAFLHVLMLLGLRAAMQPPQFARTHEVAPLQITFIERRPVVVVAKPVVPPPAVLQPRARPTPQRVPRSDALQAVSIPPRTIRVPVVTQQPKAQLYGADGALKVPDASTWTPPRDPLARRHVDWMLPGGARKDSPDFHVRDDPSPKDVVNTGLAIAAGLLSHVAPRPDQNGLMAPKIDRGLRTSGRDTDPCEDIALDEVDLNASEKEREQAGDRYEKHCEGH